MNYLKTNTNSDVGERTSNKTYSQIRYKPFQLILLLIAGTVGKLNPFNWFSDFSNIEITIEEDFLKKS